MCSEMNWSVQPRDGLTGLEFWLCHLVFMWPWTRYCTFNALVSPSAKVQGRGAGKGQTGARAHAHPGLSLLSEHRCCHSRSVPYAATLHTLQIYCPIQDCKCCGPACRQQSKWTSYNGYWGPIKTDFLLQVFNTWWWVVKQLCRKADLIISFGYRIASNDRFSLCFCSFNFFVWGRENEHQAGYFVAGSMFTKEVSIWIVCWKIWVGTTATVKPTKEHEVIEA